MKEIPLSRGKIALVDDEDFERVKNYKWYASADEPGRNTNYARTTIYKGGPNGKSRTQLLHRLILEVVDSNVHIDHINGDGLDNRKANLRIATRYENLRNQSKHKNNTSGYKGVHYRKETGKFRACIKVNNKRINIGNYDTAEEASAAYEAKAKELFDEFYRPPSED